jgi:SAM-dependent methyltransferase
MNMPATDTPVIDRICEVCGSREVRLLRHSDFWSFDVGRCPDCRMVFVLDPPPFAGEPEYVEGADWEDYVEWMRGDDALRVAVLARLGQLAPPVAAGRPYLFDVGAGVGDFVALAEQHGFSAGGNDISARGIKHAYDRHGLTLSPLLLGDQPPQSADVITMWCVLAHVNEPEQFLQEAYAMLRPGGVLFLRTPRWCVLDMVGTTAARLSRNRASRLADRRVTAGHMHIYNARNLTRQLEQVGFDQVTAEPTCHFPMSTDVYLTSTGGLARLGRRFAAVIDALIEREWFIRNTLMVYARRPLEER